MELQNSMIRCQGWAQALGHGPLCSHPLVPKVPAWFSGLRGLWLEGTWGSCGTVGDPEGADNGISC